MNEKIEETVEAMDPKTKRDLAALAQTLNELGVTDIQEATPNEVFSKSPTATPTPSEPKTAIER